MIEEQETNIEINKDTNDPDKAWTKLKNKISKVVLKPLDLNTPLNSKETIRIVCMSDTHNCTNDNNNNNNINNINKWPFKNINLLPKGDILIHAGDFTNIGSLNEIKQFNTYMGTLNDHFKYKIVIAGNHELLIDKSKNTTAYNFNLKSHKNEQQELNVNIKDLLTNCIYLQDELIEILGLKIYGSPWTPEYGGWAFNAKRGHDLLQIWNRIPSSCDILVTHGPPLGFGDRLKSGTHVGCCELLSSVIKRIRPKLHIFGHIHEDYGIWSDTNTTFINASINDHMYNPVNAPIIFDIHKK